MFRGDLQHSGVYSAVGITQSAAVKWRFKTNGQVLSSPAVADGTIYIGSSDHHLYAVDQRTGAQK